MAIIITDDFSIDLANGKKSFKDVFVTCVLATGEKRSVALTEIFDANNRPYFVDGQVAKPQETFNKMVSQHIRLADGTKIKEISSVPTLTTNVVSTDLSSTQAKMIYGLQQTIGVKSVNEQRYNAHTKLFVRLKGDKDFKLVNASEVYVFTNGTFSLLSNLTDANILNAINNGQGLNNVRLMIGNREIVELDKNKFEQEDVVDTQKFVVFGQKLLVKALGRDSYTQVDDSMVVREFAEKGDTRYTHAKRFEIDAARAGNHIYVVDKQGRTHFVDIANLFESRLATEPIDANLFASQPSAENQGYLTYVGRSLFLREGEKFIELQPLTAEQATKVYTNTTFQPTPTENVLDIATPGVFRRTKDGRYFDESTIQPLCYDYTEGTTQFTHYLFDINGKNVIVPKSKFVSRVSFKINIDGNLETLSLNGANRPRTLIRVNKPINQCAVVQTSTANPKDFNNAVVLKQSNSYEQIDNETTQKIKTDFLQLYRQGGYSVDSVFNSDGKLVELSAAPTRYKMTDYAETVDTASENIFYDNFKPATLTLKNGKFTGEVTYDRKRANKKYASGAFELTKASLTLFATPLGFLTSFALPVLPIVAAASMATVPFAMVFNAVAAATSKRRINNSIQNPLETNRQHSHNLFYDELFKLTNQTVAEWQAGQDKLKKEAIQKEQQQQKSDLEKLLDAHQSSIEQIKGAKPQKGKDKEAYKSELKEYNQKLSDEKKQFKKQKKELKRQQKQSLKTIKKETRYSLTDEELVMMLENFNILEEKIMLTFDKEIFTGGLHVVNGKAKIDGQNAYLAKEFEKMLAEKTKRIKQLSRQIKHAKGSVKNALQNELEDLLAEREMMTTDFTLTHSALKENQKSKQICLDTLNLARGWLIEKYKIFGELSAEQQKFVNNLKVDFKTGIIIYKGAVYDNMEQLGKINPKVQKFASKMMEVGKASKLDGHYDIDDNQLSIVQKEPQSLVGELADQLTNDDVAQVEQTNEQNLLEKLSNKIATLKQNNEDAAIEKIGRILKKNIVTEKDQKFIVESLARIEEQSQQLSSDLQEIKTETGNLDEKSIVDQADIKNFIDSINLFCSNIESNNSTIEKLNDIFNKNLTAAQAKKLYNQIEKLQLIMSGNQQEIIQMIDQVVGKIYVVKASSQNQQQIAALESCLKRLKVNLQAVNKANQEKSKWKKLFIEQQATIINAAKNLLEQLKTNAPSLENESKNLQALKGQIDGGTILGAKTVIDKNLKNLSQITGAIGGQISSIDIRIESLKTLKEDLKDVDDEDIKKLRDQAQRKIAALNKNKVFLQGVKIKSEDLSKEFGGLKTFVAVFDIEKSVKKSMEQTIFARKLTSSEADIKFLASVIANAVSIEKLSKTLQTADICLDAKYQAQFEEIKANLPKYFEQLKTYIRTNYNVFNQCKDFAVKEKYYKKIAGYADIDHLVEFKMPKGSTQGNQTEDGATI